MDVDFEIKVEDEESEYGGNLNLGDIEGGDDHHSLNEFEIDPLPMDIDLPNHNMNDDEKQTERQIELRDRSTLQKPKSSSGYFDPEIPELISDAEDNENDGKDDDYQDQEDLMDKEIQNVSSESDDEDEKDYIEKSIKKYSQLSKTVRTKTKIKDTTPRLCPLCGNTYKNLRQLKEHTQRMHSTQPRKPRQRNKVKSLICDKCGAAFSCPASLRHHRARHDFREMEAEEALFPCENCDASFQNLRTLLLHQIVVCDMDISQELIEHHDLQYDFESCQNCSKKFMIGTDFNR